MALPVTVERPEADSRRSVPVVRRVLVVSADMGGGHHATGRALEERVRALWPGSQVRWVDTLDAMGPGVGPAFRRLYASNVATTPWLYEFFYASLWRHRWFATAAKAFVGAWAGRRLAPVVAGFDPDLILSTYPLGTAGLAWLRERRGLGVPTGAWVSDFAPHPFWVYPQVDLNLLVHPAALPSAVAAAPDAPVAVCDVPVVGAFHRGDRHRARQEIGLDRARYLVVVACGSYGFGAVEEAVAALAAVSDRVQIAAICGRNRRLVDRLAGLGVPVGRLVVLGWVDDMPALLRAADMVVTNAGGATALEALATGTPIVMYRPIAAHGAANAALMTACGLAETCRTPSSLTACVRSRLSGSRPEVRMPAAQVADLGLGTLADHHGEQTSQRTERPPGSWPLRAQDVFFLHVQSATVAQQIGAVLDLDPLPDGRPLDREDLVSLLDRRLPAITTLRRRLVRRGRWRRPGWTVDRHVDPAAHVEVRHLLPGAHDDVASELDRFWSQPVPTDRPPWQILLIRGFPDGRAKLAVKLHHCLGDGLSAIGTLHRLLDPVDEPPRRGWRPTAADHLSGPPPHPVGTPWRTRVQRAVRTVHGLMRLAEAGPAPWAAINRPFTSAQRRLAATTMPTAELNRAARACGVHTSELACALVAEALRRTYQAQPVPMRLRAMFAVSATPRARSRTHGNWTGAVAMDLPLVPLSMPDRAVAVRDRLRQSLASGQPTAAGLVMRAMGGLPAPVHAALARWVYTRRFMNVIVSYVPGAVRPCTLAGASIRSVVPVVALAEGVPLGVGILRWADVTGIGVLLDASLAQLADAFVAALQAAFAEVRVPAGGPASRAPTDR